MAESVPEGDVIIPLYSSSQASAVERADPSEFFNYDNFEMWLSPVTPSGRTLGPDGPRLDTIGVGTTFPLTLDPLDGIEGTRDVDIYFYYVQENENSVKELHLYGEVGGEPLAYVLDDVIPLWYNMTKQCLIGYVRISNGDSISYELHEIYYSEPTNMFSVFPYTGDTSVLYNFY